MDLKDIHKESLKLFHEAKYMKSLSVANRLYGKAESLGDRVHLLKSLSMIGLNLYVLEEFEYSLSEYLHYIELIEESCPEGVNWEFINNARYGVALCYNNLGQLDMCFEYLKIVIESTKLDENKIKAYLMLGETLRKSYELTNKEEYLSQIYEYLDLALKNMDNSSQYVHHLHNIKGRALATEGKYEEAIPLFFKALAEQKDQFKPLNLNEIAYCYLMLGIEDKAIEHLKLAWDYLSKSPVPDDSEKARYHYIYGLLYKRRNNYEEAINHFIKSETLYNDHKVCLELAKVYYDLGLIYEKMQQPSKAAEYYFKYEVYKEKTNKLGGIC